MDTMLYQKIINKIEDIGTYEEFASLAGYSKGQALSKALSNGREFGSFYGLVKLVETLFPEDHVKLTSEFALEVDPNNKSARYLLEYLNLHKQFGNMKKLIQRMLSSGNATSKEWAAVYNIDLKLTYGEINALEAIGEFGKISPKSNEMKICNEIMKSYCYLIDKNYNFAYQIVSVLENSFDEITEKYIQDLFLGRILLIISECHYRNDAIEKARLYQERIFIEIKESKIKILSYLHQGNSLIMENCDKAIECFKKGIELAGNNHVLITNLKRSINFTYNFWRKSPLYLNIHSEDASDIHEVAFSKINTEQYDEATSLLNKINIKELNKNSLGFHYYLRGLISNKEDDFCQSAINFKDSCDFHFIKLPLIELKKKGYSEMLIKLILA